MKKYGKFVALAAVVVATVVWLAASGMSGNQTYYKSIAELGKMGHDGFGKRVRVGGDIESGSIQRAGHEVHFVLKQDNLKLNVAYTGSDPLPDSFRDGAQALADGKLDPDGLFRAAQIQAKCASKYEAKVPGTAPTGKSSI